MSQSQHASTQETTPRTGPGTRFFHDRSARTLGTMLALALLLLTACAGPKPILYPNAHLQEVGEAVAERDIDECRALAEDAGATPGKDKGQQVAESTVVGGAVGAASGAVGGAIVGAAGRGSAIGAAAGATGGLLRGLFRAKQPSQAYMNFVNRCLQERGYEPTGWD